MKQSQDYESPRIAELVTAALRPAAVVPAPPWCTYVIIYQTIGD